MKKAIATIGAVLLAGLGILITFIVFLYVLAVKYDDCY